MGLVGEELKTFEGGFHSDESVELLACGVGFLIDRENIFDSANFFHDVQRQRTMGEKKLYSLLIVFIGDISLDGEQRYYRQALVKGNHQMDVFLLLEQHLFIVFDHRLFFSVNQELQGLVARNVRLFAFVD